MQGERVGTAVQTARRLPDERLRVRRWRVQQFEELGFSHTDARFLAKSHADVHDLRKLLVAGCEHATAFRIVR